MQPNPFPTDYPSILELMHRIQPTKYAASRNFIDGAVTYLSPYISRGVITLPQVLSVIQQKGFTAAQSEKLVQELAWREYFQQIWIALGDKLLKDIKQSQPDVLHHLMPKGILTASTGIEAVDAQIEHLYTTGYMHNHARMYVAALTCNIARAYWLMPSQWMYYHLLDGDIASNTCSWQWVAGAFSNKKYVANQTNINTYLYSQQQKSFLDVAYEDLLGQTIPTTLSEVETIALQTALPTSDTLELDYEKPLLIYHYYHLNPLWRKDEAANRVLILEPRHFAQFPISNKVLNFIMELGKNIPNLQVFVGNIDNFPSLNKFPSVCTVAHPIVAHFPVQMDEPARMFPNVKGYYPSFFSYWKKCERYVKQYFTAPILPL